MEPPIPIIQWVEDRSFDGEEQAHVNNSLYRPEEADDTIAAAMRIVRHADALIVDVRGHSGGSPDTTVLFASYFFDQAEKPLFRIVDRVGNDRG